MITHLFTSPKPASADATKVDGPKWNDDHNVDDGTLILSKLQTITSGALLGRATALTGSIEALTAAQVKVILAISIGDVSGLSAALASLASIASLAAIAFSGLATDLVGSLPTTKLPAFVGDVTSTAGTATTVIAAQAVSNAKLANMGAATLKGSVAGGAPADLTATQAKGVLAITPTDVSGLAAIASSGSATDLITGAVPAARMPAHTGDVTSSAGAVALTIAANVVTNAKSAQMPTLTVKGNNTGGTANAADLTAAQTKALLAIASTDVSGLATIATTGSATDLTTGAVPAARMPALTGDATSGAGTVALTIATNAVTNAKAAQMATLTIKGNNTGGTANAADLTATQVKALLAIASTDVSGLAAIATSGSATDLSTGAVPAARMPALTGDATSVIGTVALTIASAAVTNAKLANQAANSLKGNNTGSAAAPIDLTTSQVKTLLAIASSDVSGLAAIATSGSATDLSTGAVPAARMPAHTGDVTSSIGTVALTIATAAVTNAKLANQAANSLKGNNTGSSATPIDLTTAQVKTLLAIASSDVSGLAAIATSGSATDLSGGTVPAARMPAHTGDVTSSAGAVALTVANDAVTYAKMQNVSATQRALGRNTAGAGDTEEVTASQLFDWISSTNGVLLTRVGGSWAALANIGTAGGDLLLTEDTAPTTPAAGKSALFGSSSGGRQMLATLGPTGTKMLMQPFLGGQHRFEWAPTMSSTILSIGISNIGSVGTITGGAIATTNLFTLSRRAHGVSAAGAGSLVSHRTATLYLCRQQGFHIVYRFGISDASIITTGRTFVGLRDTISAATDVDPSGLANIIGVGCDANDPTLQLYAAGSSAQARAALVIGSGPNVGGSFPMNTVSVDFYEFAFYSAPGGTTITYQVTRLNTGDVAVGTISAAASLFSTTTLMTNQVWRSNGATATAIGLDLFGMYGDTDT